MSFVTSHNVLTPSYRWRFHLNDAFALPDMNRGSIIHKGPHSRILGFEDTSDYVAKLVLYRSQPRDNLRKYVNCQAFREYRSARLMEQLGLAVPAVYGYGFSLSPIARYESILFLERLGKHTTALQKLQRCNDVAARRDLLDRVAAGAARIYGNGYQHKDCHFANVILDERDSLIWIDNDIRQPRTYSRLRRGLTKSVKLLNSTGQLCLRDGEWPYFLNAFKTELRQKPFGPYLSI